MGRTERYCCCYFVYGHNEYAIVHAATNRCSIHISGTRCQRQVVNVIAGFVDMGIVVVAGGGIGFT